MRRNSPELSLFLTTERFDDGDMIIRMMNNLSKSRLDVSYFYFVDDLVN